MGGAVPSATPGSDLALPALPRPTMGRGQGTLQVLYPHLCSNAGVKVTQGCSGSPGVGAACPATFGEHTLPFWHVQETHSSPGMSPIFSLPNRQGTSLTAQHTPCELFTQNSTPKGLPRAFGTQYLPFPWKEHPQLQPES